MAMMGMGAFAAREVSILQTAKLIEFVSRVELDIRLQRSAPQATQWQQSITVSIGTCMDLLDSSTHL